MNNEIHLVTPFDQFKNTRNSKNFISFLEYLGKIKKIPIEDFKELEIINLVEINHQNFKEFNTELWSALDKLDLSIEWYKYIEKKDSSKEECEPEDKNLTIARENVFELIKREDDIKKDLMEKESTFLLYFSEINELLKSNKDFELPLRLAKEISEYLKEITFSEKNNLKKIKNHISDELWDLIYPNICNIFIKFLEEENIKDELEMEVRLSLEFQCLNSWILLSWISITKITSDKIFNQPSNNFLEKCKHIRTPLLDALNGLVEDLKNESKKEHNQPSKEYVDIWIMISASMLLFTNSRSFVISKAYDVVIDSFLEYAYEIWYTDIEEIVYKPIELLLASFFEEENINDNPMVQRLYNKKINFDKITKLASESTNREFSEKFCKKLLNDNSCFSWEDDQAFHILNKVSECYVSICNRKFKEDGIPHKLNLELNSDTPHKPYAKYFECISTIGINLSTNLHNDIYYQTNPTERIVTGARIISDAGLTDHALSFLGYGLLKISLNPKPLNNFSISEVSRFINDPKISLRIDKILLPFLKLIIVANEHISISNKIWINNILMRYKSADIHLIDFNRDQLNSFKDQNQFKIPAWFSEEDHVLIQNLHSYRGISNRNNEMNIEQWRRLCHNNNARSMMIEISQSIESVILELFLKTYTLIQAEKVFRETLKNSGIDLKTDRPLDLGFVEFFMFNIKKISHQNSLSVIEIIDVANTFDLSIGKAIFKIKNSHDGVIKSLQHFRNIDNLYFSHKIDRKNPGNNIMPQSEANWLYTYATTDLANIYELFH